jgi:hypothetical protein
MTDDDILDDLFLGSAFGTFINQAIEQSRQQSAHNVGLIV